MHSSYIVLAIKIIYWRWERPGNEASILPLSFWTYISLLNPQITPWCRQHRTTIFSASVNPTPCRN